ncbi:MAG: HDIG domain-containing metalloprotein [Minisyncoccales bacterium]
MEREEAFLLLQEKIKNENLIKHSLAVEAGMKALASFFKENEKDWALAGLLHDIDYEETKNNFSLHSKMAVQFLEEKGVKKEICQVVLTHNEIHQILPESKMTKVLFCFDQLTGLIVASVLVLRSKKIKDLTVENVLHRFKEKSFAKGAKREIIKKCQEYLGLPLEKFIEIVLESMKKISDDLGL